MIFEVGVRETQDIMFRSRAVEYYCMETPDDDESLELESNDASDWHNSISELYIRVSATNPLEAFTKGIQILHDKLTEEYGRGIWEFYSEETNA